LPIFGDSIAKDKVAPFPAIRVTTADRLKSTLTGRSVAIGLDGKPCPFLIAARTTYAVASRLRASWMEARGNEDAR
jgi:hypothetical protein